MAGVTDEDTFIGKKVQESRGLLSIKYPMEHGVVQNWADMERIWQHIYDTELNCSSEEVQMCNWSFVASCASDRGSLKSKKES